MKSDEDYFYPHFGKFNEGTIRISPTFSSSDNELSLLRALNIKHRDWESQVVRVSMGPDAGPGKGRVSEYRGICDFQSGHQSSRVAGICALTVYDDPAKMILQLESGDGGSPITSLILKRDSPGDNFLGWVLRKSMDVSRAGNESLSKLERSSYANEEKSSSTMDETQNQQSMIKNSGEFRDMVMEMMSRDANTLASAETKLEQMTSWFRDERDRLASSVLDISQEMTRVNYSEHHQNSSSSSNSSSRHGSPSRSPSQPPHNYSQEEHEHDQKHRRRVREQMDKFRSNVEQSIDSAFADSIGSSEEVMVKLYYTGRDPRLPALPSQQEFSYEAGKDPGSMGGYVQERANSSVSEVSHAAEALEGNEDYSQLKRALGRFQGDVESLIKESFEENEEYRQSLGLNTSFESNLGRVGVRETPSRGGGGSKSKISGNKSRGKSIVESDDDSDDEDDNGGEVSVEEEAAEIQSLLSGFLKTHKRADWGHTHHPHSQQATYSTHHIHDHPAEHATYHKPGAHVPHYMQTTDSSRHHEADLSTKTHVRGDIEHEEARRAAHHHEQHMIESIFGHGYDSARTHDHHHGVPTGSTGSSHPSHHVHAHTAPHHATHKSPGSVSSSTPHRKDSLSSIASHSSALSTKSSSTSSPSKKVSKVSSSLLAPTASSRAHLGTTGSDSKKSSSLHSHSPASTSSPTKKTTSSTTAAKKERALSSASSVCSETSKVSHKSHSTAHSTHTQATAHSTVDLMTHSKPSAAVHSPVAEAPSPLSIASPSSASVLARVLESDNNLREGEREEPAGGGAVSLESSPSPFGLISGASSIAPLPDPESSFSSPRASSPCIATGAGTSTSASGGGTGDAVVSSIVATPGTGSSEQEEYELSPSVVVAATLASLEAHYEAQENNSAMPQPPTEAGDVDLGSGDETGTRTRAHPPAAPSQSVAEDTLLGHKQQQGDNTLDITGTTTTTTTTATTRAHDATWEPRSTNYLTSTFSSAQQEQDGYTKAHTLEMILDEEKARHRHHKDIMDPERAYMRSSRDGGDGGDNISVTSSISDWTIEKETKKKVKKMKKAASGGTKKTTKKAK
jgi:hypothetical protein